MEITGDISGTMDLFTEPSRRRVGIPQLIGCPFMGAFVFVTGIIPTHPNSVQRPENTFGKPLLSLQNRKAIVLRRRLHRDPGGSQIPLEKHLAKRTEFAQTTCRRTV
jgi:hypothetical protein